MHIACCPLAKGHTPRVCSSDRIVEIRPRCVETAKTVTTLKRWLPFFCILSVHDPAHFLQDGFFFTGDLYLGQAQNFRRFALGQALIIAQLH